MAPPRRAPRLLTAPWFRLRCVSLRTFRRMLGVFFCGYRYGMRIMTVGCFAVGLGAIPFIVGVYFSLVHRELFRTPVELAIMTPLTLYVALGVCYLWVRVIMSDPGYTAPPGVTGIAADFTFNTSLDERPAPGERTGEASDDGASATAPIDAARKCETAPLPLDIVSAARDYVRYERGEVTVRELYARYGGEHETFDEFDKAMKRHCRTCHVDRLITTHHCRTCQRCVRAMDHHCPFINNCVGVGNRGLFLATLFYVVAGAAYSALACGARLYALGVYSDAMRDGLRYGVSIDVVRGSLFALRNGTFAAWHRPLLFASLALSLACTVIFGVLLVWFTYLAVQGITSLDLFVLLGGGYRPREMLSRLWPRGGYANINTHLAPHGLRPGALLWHRW